LRLWKVLPNGLVQLRIDYENGSAVAKAAFEYRTGLDNATPTATEVGTVNLDVFESSNTQRREVIKLYGDDKHGRPVDLAQRSGFRLRNKFNLRGALVEQTYRLSGDAEADELKTHYAQLSNNRISKVTASVDGLIVQSGIA
jgi:hypothetical protein